MTFRLTTLGGLHAAGDGGELDGLLALRSRAALLIYLAVERQVSREHLLTVFWPESDTESARHALRQALYQLRTSVGSGWLETRAHELRVSDGVWIDTHAFEVALERADHEAAARLYKGPFLHGVHLVDLKPWESWVDARRATYARGFRRACRSWLDERGAAGDLSGALAAAQCWVMPDPLDDEAQHRLIETLALAGERAEAIRQFETYTRALEPDGLRPLDDTIALVDRIRREAAAWPERHEPELPPEQAPSIDRGAAAPHPRPVPRSSRRMPSLVASLAVVLTFAMIAVLHQRRADSAPSAHSMGIVVLPFSVHGSDEGQYLGEGVVTLLSTALDGAGPYRAVDTRAMFGTLAQEGGTITGIVAARRMAERLGAGLFVLGDVVQAGDRIHLDAGLYDTRGGARRARAAVSGSTDQLMALVDQLAAQMIAGLEDAPGDRLTRVAAATTTSFPAFKEYLEGEQHVREGSFERAADAYMEAIRHDSTYAIALYRLALMRDWSGVPEGVHAAAEAAVRHASRLSPRDRALLEAFLAYLRVDVADAERRYRAILARHPDDLEAWYQLGEVLFHFGPLHGRSVDESEEAWRRVLSYEPRNLGARMHLARVAGVKGRGHAIDSLLQPFDAPSRRRDRRLVHIEITRAVARGDTATVMQLAREAGQWEENAIWHLVSHLTAMAHDPATADVMLRELLAPHRSRSVVADIHLYRAYLHLATGQLRAAAEAHRQAIAAQGAAPSEWYRSTYATVSEWWISTFPLPFADTTLERVRRAAAAMDVGRWHNDLQDALRVSSSEQVWMENLAAPSALQALRQYTLALLSLRLHEDARALEAAESLERLAGSGGADPLVRDLNRGVRARLAWRAGRTAEALATLESMELTRASVGGEVVVPFIARAHERYLRGVLLAELGRDAEAVRWFASLGESSAPESPYRALAHLRQAEIHERRGRRADARLHLTRAAELWRSSDPELRPLLSGASQPAARPAPR